MRPDVSMYGKGVGDRNTRAKDMGKDGQWNIEHTVIEQHRDGGVAEGATAVADRPNEVEVFVLVSLPTVSIVPRAAYGSCLARLGRRTC